MILYVLGEPFQIIFHNPPLPHSAWDASFLLPLPLLLLSPQSLTAAPERLLTQPQQLPSCQQKRWGSGTAGHAPFSLYREGKCMVQL